jgi:hypothetical protein
MKKVVAKSTVESDEKKNASDIISDIFSIPHPSMPGIGIGYLVIQNYINKKISKNQLQTKEEIREEALRILDVFNNYFIYKIKKHSKDKDPEKVFLAMAKKLDKNLILLNKTMKRSDVDKLLNKYKVRYEEFEEKSKSISKISSGSSSSLTDSIARSHSSSFLISSTASVTHSPRSSTKGNLTLDLSLSSFTSSSGPLSPKSPMSPVSMSSSLSFTKKTTTIPTPPKSLHKRFLTMFNKGSKEEIGLKDEKKQEVFISDLEQKLINYVIGHNDTEEGFNPGPHALIDSCKDIEEKDPSREIYSMFNLEDGEESAGIITTFVMNYIKMGCLNNEFENATTGKIQVKNLQELFISYFQQEAKNGTTKDLQSAIGAIKELLKNYQDNWKKIKEIINEVESWKIQLNPLAEAEDVGVTEAESSTFSTVTRKHT